MKHGSYMDIRHSVLSRIIASSNFSAGLAEQSESSHPAQLVTQIHGRLGPIGLLKTLRASGLNEHQKLSKENVALSSRGLYLRSGQFASEHVHIDSFSDRGIVYSGDVSITLAGDHELEQFSSAYLSAELSSIHRFGVSKLFRRGSLLMAQCGKKIFPYRHMSVQERGFLSPKAVSIVKKSETPSWAENLVAALENTSRSLFFVCGDLDLASVGSMVSHCLTEVKIVSDEDFYKNLPSHLNECSRRRQRLVVVTSAMDSVATYSYLRSLDGFDLTKFMLSFGGLWSCVTLPKLCPHCRVEKNVKVNHIEHGISFNGLLSSAGHGCLMCLRGYIGSINIEEQISAETVEVYFKALLRFERRFSESEIAQPLAMTSEYAAAEPRLSSIYQSLYIAVQQHDVSVEDATLLLL